MIEIKLLETNWKEDYRKYEIVKDDKRFITGWIKQGEPFCSIKTEPSKLIEEIKKMYSFLF